MYTCMTEYFTGIRVHYFKRRVFHNNGDMLTIMQWKQEKTREIYRVKVWKELQQNVINIFSWKVGL